MEEKTVGKRKQKNNRFIFLLVGGFILVLVVSLATLTGKTTVKSNDKAAGDGKSENTVNGEKAQLSAIVTGWDEVKEAFTLRNIADGQEVELLLTEGSAVTDKYGKNILSKSLKLGEMVEASYYTDSLEIITLSISDKVWRYENISNWSMNKEEGSFAIAERLYRYSDFLFITRDGKVLKEEDLDSTDELMALGIDKTIYSVIVTKGHGTLYFTEYDDFLGGTVYVGKKEVLPIEEDMKVTVREGDYEITMEKGSLTGTKNVKVIADSETEVNMEEFKKPPVQTGEITFHITPAGAQLYLDDLQVAYETPVDVEYGEHSMRVTLGGYKEYTGTLTVGEEVKDIFVKLVTSENSEESTAGESTSSSGSSSESDGTNTNTDSSGISNGDSSSGSNSSGTDSGSTDTADTDTTEDSGSTANYVYLQKPEGASVYVNGEFKGIAPVSFPKTAGQLYITLIQSGYDTKTYTVEVKDDGEDVNLNFADMEASQ